MIRRLLDAILQGIDWLLFPPPPDDMIYCPDCGGTGYNKLWLPCEHCNAIGYVPRYSRRH